MIQALLEAKLGLETQENFSLTEAWADQGIQVLQTPNGDILLDMKTRQSPKPLAT